MAEGVTATVSARDWGLAGSGEFSEPEERESKFTRGSSGEVGAMEDSSSLLLLSLLLLLLAAAEAGNLEGFLIYGLRKYFIQPRQLSGIRLTWWSLRAERVRVMVVVVVKG